MNVLRTRLAFFLYFSSLTFLPSLFTQFRLSFLRARIDGKSLKSTLIVLKVDKQNQTRFTA